ISRMLKSVGVEHESHLAAKLDERVDAILRGRNNIDDQLPNLIATASQQDDSVKPTADTLKSLLLQLTASDDTPAPLKEAAQQAIGQITGQQLMLTGDKSSMFAHMTLFVPFIDGTGQQSAAIHIQSRKGKRGEVDASNCRLLFDLQMKVMGNTLLDVHVVNKIVSLNIHNDHPALASLMEESKEEITAAMNKAGYQFISLKCSPYPQPPVIENEA
ncbi:DNA ligase, partial [Paenibacillus sp. TAF58]